MNETRVAGEADVAGTVPPLLECRGLTKSFRTRLALAPVDFSITVGENLAIIGPSGCGKTTLLRLVAGLMNPSAGEVRERGRVVSHRGWQLEPHRRSLGFLFEDLALWPHMTVRAHLRFAVQAAVEAPDAVDPEEKIRRILEQASLGPLAERRPAELSGGERQRVAWARAVVGEPEILLLDEPLTSLDPGLRRELLEWTVDYGRRPGRSVAVVTHDREVAGRIGHRVLELG